MSDFDPGVVRRMLMLRRYGLFGGADLADLATVAENLTECVLPRGSIVVPPCSHVPAIHLILDGRLETRARDRAMRVWGPREIFGELEVFAKHTQCETVVAAVETHTLQLASADVSELLEDNYALLLSELRDLARRFSESRGVGPRHLTVPQADPFGLVERLIVLRQQASFAHSHLHALAAIAHASEEVHARAGTVLARKGEPVSESLVVLDGQIAVGHGGLILGPGTTFGDLETLAGLAHASDIEAVTAVRLLRSSDAAIFDALEDHADFGVAMVGRLAGALVQRGMSARDSTMRDSLIN